MRRRRRNNNTTNKLDLHGVRHADVEVMVEEYVLLNQPPIEIVTGNSEEMKKIVKAVLDRHDFKYIQPGWNLGVIYVSH